MTPPPGSGPERIAREEIDKLLNEAGWTVQSRDEINLSAARGVAIREFKLAEGYGYADYLHFVDERAIGVLEAKPQGHTLGGVGGGEREESPRTSRRERGKAYPPSPYVKRDVSIEMRN